MIKNSLSTQFNDYNLGYKLEHDAQTLKSLLVAAVLKTSKGDFYFKADALKKVLATGCSHRHGDKALHSYEIVYDVAGETKGINGLPVQFNWAGEYPINEHITWKSRLHAKDDVNFAFTWIQKLDKNLKLAWTDNVNLTNLALNPAKPTYTFGAMFQWDL